MSEAGAEATVYVIPRDRVRESLKVLLARRTHQFFPAYLYLRWLAARKGQTTGLSPSWPELGRRLEVPGGPEGKPYLRPFWWPGADTGLMWLNKNLAGSYAPSSLRKAPMNVIEIDAAGRYNLRDEHWLAALKHLLYDERMPVLALAAFLLRDYGVLASSPPGPSEVVRLFRKDYGYRSEDAVEFEFLYDDTWTGDDGLWSEPAQYEVEIP